MAYTEKTAEAIKNQAANLRKHLARIVLTVYGEPADLEDPDTLLVAAFRYGKDVGFQEAVNIYDVIDDSELHE